jgi:hypothetical protein
MFVYEVYYRDHKNNSTNMIGALTERRRDPKRLKELIPSALRWARKEFGGLVADPNAIFIVGKNLDLPLSRRMNIPEPAQVFGDYERA